MGGGSVLPPPSNSPTYNPMTITTWTWPDPDLADMLADREADIRETDMSDWSDGTEYLASVHASVDPATGLLSFGDAARLLQAHGTTWDEYVQAGGSMGSWPIGSRNPHHVLGFLGY